MSDEHRNIILSIEDSMASLQENMVIVRMEIPRERLIRENIDLDGLLKGVLEQIQESLNKKT